jgi:hypothetical protein
MSKDTDLQARLAAFCNEYDIPEKYHGSLTLLASMAFVLGLEIQMNLQQREEKEAQ